MTVIEFTEELYGELKDAAARSKSNQHRLDELEPKVEEIHKTEVEMAGMKKDMDHVKESVDEIKGDVKKIMEKPGQWWDKVLLALIGGVVGYLLKMLGVF